MILGVRLLTASSKLCSFPVQKACMLWGWKEQVLCLSSPSLYCPWVQCHLIFAVLKYIECIILKPVGLLPTYTVGPA